MRYTMTITEAAHDRLLEAVCSVPDREGAAFLLCGRSKNDGETRLLVRDVIAVESGDYLVREQDRLSIASRSYVRAAKRASELVESVVFVHSHPTGVDDFSKQDDREEPKLMEFLGNRLPDRVHGSLLVISGTQLRGRVWMGRSWERISRIRVLGHRFRFVDEPVAPKKVTEFFDRQVRAFGGDVQLALRYMHIGVVGVGGTGSAVLEQLVRLGVGTMSVFDGETFDVSNVSRVYGSRTGEEGRLKVDIAKRNVEAIGLGTVIRKYERPITEEGTARALRACDVVFGCTDKQAPRGILVRLALWYQIPVIDVGVKLDAPDGLIRGIIGRVTVLMPGEACLFCRKRISPEIIRLESLTPDEQRLLADENYAPPIEDAAPAVVTFTTAVAAQGVSELLHRLTGFMGSERHSSETLLFLHERTIKTNRPAPDPGCLCAQQQCWGMGDRRSFLDLAWTK